MTDPSTSARGPAAVDWQRHVEAWNAILTADRGIRSPPAVRPGPRDRFVRWAQDVLPQVGGTVLDVACGEGRAAMSLVPPASELIGVDHSGAALDRFVAAANEAGVARRTVHGTWPDVAASTPVADVVVCRDVLYTVAEIVPFLLALTAHARLAVVVEVPTRHPSEMWREAWRRVRGSEPPHSPTAEDLVAVVRELGFDPEVELEERIRPQDRPDAATVDGEPARPDPDGTRVEMADARFAEHPLEGPGSFAVIRWPGHGEA